MGGASSWYAIISITGFFTWVAAAGYVSKFIGISSILLEVAVGIVFGPQGLNLISQEHSYCYHDATTDCSRREDLLDIANKGYEYCDLQAYIDANKYSPGDWKNGFFGGDNVAVTLDNHVYCLDGSTNCSSDGRRLASDNKGKAESDSYDQCLKDGCELNLALECATTPDIFTLIGHTGVAMMIFESGMHFDFEQAKTVGPWACVVAVVGTFLPIAAGTGVAMAFGFPIFPDGLAAGVSLAPTSVGIALKLLHDAQALETNFGQAVMTAAFVDDVLSLILFSILFSLGGDITFMSFLPLILGCVFMVVAIIGAVTVWPWFIKFLKSKIPDHHKKGDEKIGVHDEVMFVLMFVTLVAYGQITHLCGTHLWGCFIAGMSFAMDHSVVSIWVRQTKRYTHWFIRIFFACTLAWSIPVDQLFTIEAFWKGTIMGIGPCIATKVLCAPFMGPARFVIGWAMVGRAEFAYFIAILARSLRMIDEKLFAILIWALIYGTIFAPLIFRKVLARHMRRSEENLQDTGPRTIRHQATGHLPDLKAEAKKAKAMEEQEANLRRRELLIVSQDTQIANLRNQMLEFDAIKQELEELRKAKSGQTEVTASDGLNNEFIAV